MKLHSTSDAALELMTFHYMLHTHITVHSGHVKHSVSTDVKFMYG